MDTSGDVMIYYVPLDFINARAWIVLVSNEIAISMDGKRRWVDNVFVERLWRSEKYEEVYLHVYDDIRSHSTTT